MINEVKRSCSRASFTKLPRFNVDGSKTPSYCTQRSENGMVLIHGRRCSHDTCKTAPSQIFMGTKTAAYCRQHALDSVVSICLTKHCRHDSCTRRPGWGVLTDCTATVCPCHKNDRVGAPANDIRAKCNVEVWAEEARWGSGGKHTTHIYDQAPLKNGLVCSLPAARRKRGYPSQSYHAARGPSFHFSKPF